MICESLDPARFIQLFAGEMLFELSVLASEQIFSANVQPLHQDAKRRLVGRRLEIFDDTHLQTVFSDQREGVAALAAGRVVIDGQRCCSACGSANSCSMQGDEAYSCGCFDLLMQRLSHRTKPTHRYLEHRAGRQRRVLLPPGLSPSGG